MSFVTVLACITPTRADEPQRSARRPQASAQRENPEYRALIDEALREFELGNANEALVLFQRAHAIEPNARTLRGIGFCLFEARRYVEALGHLQQALTDARNPLTPALRASTQQLLDRASAFVGRVNIALVPDSARLLIDGAEAELKEARLFLDPGEHELSASAPGHQGRTLKVLVKSGDNESIQLALTSIDAPAPVAPEPAPRSAKPAPRDTPPSPLRRGLMIGGFSVAGAGVVAGAVTGVLALLAEGDLDKQCPDHGCPPDYFDDLDRANGLALGSTIAFSVAGAGLVCGIVGAVLGRRDKPPARAGRVSLRATTSGLSGT
ncbi:MAG TPA: tetratricopeptide repeat protein, partial [Polyangiales bacterium]